jgi:flagellar biosynthetic protein FliR
MQEIVTFLGAAWITTVLLLTVRIAALLLLTPVLYAVAMPLTVRVLVVVALACVVALPFGGAPAVPLADRTALLAAVLREAMVGATLGLGVLMAFGGFALAGRLVDVQVGFGIAQVFDPLTRARLPILSAAFGLLAALFFFLVDGHHALLRGIAYSVERFPVGAGWPQGAAAEPLARQAAGLFTLGFALAAPIVLGLLLVEFVLGVVARNLPQMNMLVLGIPVKILAALLALSVWAGGFAAPARRLYAGIYEAWAAWFQAGGLR